ncbi:hypothetical protein DVH24_005488 [Malus domestica]|uniref:Uncharacterized protein n=1 Tax=Malus domestica TaxID=3750 RepID=A0A498KPS2_MALDO|nr:hypothetical protein DVH24_005488 [Malus domestica]
MVIVVQNVMSSFQRAEMKKEEEAKCETSRRNLRWILFDSQRGQAQGVPPRPTAEAVNPSQSGKAMDESFDKEVEDVNRDTKAYEACLKCLEGERREVLGEADFLKEKLKGASFKYRLMP